MTSERASTSACAPIGGALYRHPRLRGRWRCETAGRTWITLRSLEVVSPRGYFAWLQTEYHGARYGSPSRVRLRSPHARTIPGHRLVNDA